VEDLDEYLTNQFHLDRQDLRAVEVLLGEAVTTLMATHSAKGWPYEVRPTGFNKPKGLSHSTTAMVLLAIEKTVGRGGRALQRLDLPQYPALKLNDNLVQQLTDVANNSFSALQNEILKRNTLHTSSKTYGKNDPITLSYLADLCRIKNTPQGARQEKLRARVRAAIKKLAAIAPADGLTSGRKCYFQKLEDSRVVSDAFIPLRVIHAATAIGAKPISGYGEFFESRLHDQLSFSMIPDSRFDPAELTFCLEGLLLSRFSLGSSTVDHALFERALAVLNQAQKESAYWRPTKPFLANERGMVLFPLSVEAANSLLRSCELFDRDRLHGTFGSANLGLFRRYWQWLQARMVRIELRGTRLVGWNSEHVNEPDAIHVWHTSQIVEFLLSYRRLLQVHMARTTLVRSRFTVIERPLRRPDEKVWKKELQQLNPVKALGKNYAIYPRLDRDFVQGWRNDSERRSRSMLLYGPPGTGKTKLAKQLARALGFSLITVTVSDFLGRGGSYVEARAKAIFDVLSSQADCVVLFDEIDNFLLDRDSDRYAKQDTVFQFMTPGMLTKLNDLRMSERIIFIVATNYANRIDSAIERVGRIDQHYLLLPPDADSRWRMIKEALQKHKQKVTDFRPSKQGLVRASVLLGDTEIQSCVFEVCRKANPNAKALIDKLSERGRSVTPENYTSRFPDGKGKLDDAAPPIEEFLCLAALAAEVDASDYLTGRAFARAKKWLSDNSPGTKMSELLKTQVIGIPSALRLKIANVLKDIPGKSK
jgi:hypothetical protein